jgi:hypothetical protein
MRLTRQELYQRVCSKPLSKLAPEFGISGPALSAICKRHDVPFPGSGYWTRKSLGLPVELPSLPDQPDHIIELAASNTKVRQTRETASKSKTLVEPTKASRKKWHSLLTGVEQQIRKAREVKEGEFLRPFKRILPDIISSETTLPKALSVANDLYLALDRHGCRVQIASSSDNLRRARIDEQEIGQKNRKYGRYHYGSIWSPDRPTIFYIGDVPMGITITEMTERVTLRYLQGAYHREDSRVIRSMKSWQAAQSWTDERDMPSGRLRVVIYSPVNNVDWFRSWQDTSTDKLMKQISSIVSCLQEAAPHLRGLMAAEQEAAARRKRQREEEWERYRRREDEQKLIAAHKDSQLQLAEIIASWGRAMVVEQFLADAEKRLGGVPEQRRLHLETRINLARQMLGTVDPLDFLEGWLAPDDRYQSVYDRAEGPLPRSGRTDDAGD